MPDGKPPANMPPQPVAKQPTPKNSKAIPSPIPAAIPPIGSLSRECNGQGVAAALPYDKTALGQRPPNKYSHKQILNVFSRDANSASPSAYQPGDYDFNLDGKWQASTNTEEMETCEYKTVGVSGQTCGEAMQFKLYGSEMSLTLREVKTSKVLNETTFIKEDSCPDNKLIASFDPKKREIIPTMEVFQKDIQTFLTPYFGF